METNRTQGADMYTIDTDTIDQAAWLEGLRRDFEGLNCDYCGKPMIRGDRRWITSNGPTCYHCSEQCAASWNLSDAYHAHALEIGG
jgi:hypothetical protein